MQSIAGLLRALDLLSEADICPKDYAPGPGQKATRRSMSAIAIALKKSKTRLHSRVAPSVRRMIFGCPHRHDVAAVANALRDAAMDVRRKAKSAPKVTDLTYGFARPAPGPEVAQSLEALADRLEGVLAKNKGNPRSLNR